MCLIYGSTHAHDEPPPHCYLGVAITIDGEGGATRLTAGLLPTEVAGIGLADTLLLDATNRLVGVAAWDFAGTQSDSLGSECRYRLAGHDSGSPSEHADRPVQTASLSVSASSPLGAVGAGFRYKGPWHSASLGLYMMRTGLLAQ
jgi:hypothetical protein